MKPRHGAPHGDIGKQARENRHVQAGEKCAPPLDEDGVLEIVVREETPFLLMLDCVQDPHNLGAILRTADAAGVHAVIAPKDKEKLKAAGVWLVGTSDHAASRSIYDLDLKGPLCLVMGAEEKGLRRLTAENCDFLASIPMTGSVGCLNVSVATGVCVFEALRQRRNP